MEITIQIIQILAAVAGCLAALMSVTLFIRVNWPTPVLWIVKLVASALSRLLFLTGILCVIVGLTTNSIFLGAIGIYVAVVFLQHVISVTRPPNPCLA